MADTIKGITIEIGGKTDPLNKALDNVKKQSNTIQKELKEVEKLLKLDPTNTELVAQKQTLLADAVNIAKTKLNALKLAQEQVEAQFKSGDMGEPEYRAFQRQVIEAEQAVQKAVKAQADYAEECENAGKDVKELGDKTEDAGKDVKEFGDKTEDAGKDAKEAGEESEKAGKKAKESGEDAKKGGNGWETFGKIAKAAGKIAIAGITTIATGTGTAIKFGNEFESAFAGVKKTVDASEEELAELRHGILDMSSEIPTAAADISAVSEAAGQLGIKTKDILNFTRTMVDLGESTNLSADEAASALAKFANIVRMDADNYSNLGSVIVALGNNFATTEADIVSMATRIASTGEIVGLSEAQIMAVATSLSSVGIEAEAGGSAISKLLKQMEVAVKTYGTASDVINSTGYSLRELELMASLNSEGFKGVASSLDLTTKELKSYMSSAADLEDFADIANLAADDFIDAWGEDAVGALSLFINGLNDTERTGKSAVEILSDMGLTEIRLSNAVLALASSGGILTDAVQLSNKAWEENTALAKEAEQRYKTFESKSTVLINGAKNLGIEVYDSLRPSLMSLVDLGSEMVGNLSAALRGEGGLEGLVQEVGNVLASGVAKISELAPSVVDSAMSLIQSFLSGIIASLPQITESAVQIVTKLALGIIDMLPMILNAGLQIIVALINGIAAALPDIIQAIVDMIPQLVQAITDNLPLIIDAGITLLLSLTQGLIDAIPQLLDALPAIIEALLNGILEAIPQLIEAGIQLLTALVEALPTIIQKIVEVLPQIITSIISALMENLPLIVQAGIDLLVALVDALPIIIAMIVEVLPQIIAAVIGTLLGNLDQFIGAGVQLLTALVTALPTIIQKIVVVLPKIITAVIGTLLGNLDKIISAGVQLLTALVTALPTIIKKIVEVLPQIITAVISALLGNLGKIISAGVQLLTALVTALPQIITTIVAALPKIIMSIVDALTGNIDKIIDAGIQLFVALVENTPKIIAGIVKTIPKIITGLIDAIINFVPKMADAGLNLLQGLWNGISNAASWLWDKISGFFGGIVDKIKGFFGIASPSKLFRDMIGKNLIAGIEVGVEMETPNLQESLEDNLAAATAGLQASVEAEEMKLNVAAAATAPTGSGLPLGGFSLNIENFINNTEKDIQQIIEEFMYAADEYIRRKGGAFA